jgi:hypothetical protein
VQVVVIEPTVSGLVEDKDQAIRIRDQVILPTILEEKRIAVDLRQARIITHSFVHALLYQALRVAGKSAPERIYVQAKEPQVRDIVRIVGHYALEDDSDQDDDEDNALE